MMGADPLNRALCVVHYVYPAAIFFYYLASSSVAVCTLQTKSSAKAKHARRGVLSNLLFAFIIGYVLQLVLLLADGSVLGVWPNQDKFIGLLSSVLIFGVQQSSLSDDKSFVWYPFYGSWLIAAAIEPVILTLQSIIYYSHDRSAKGDLLFWIEVSLIIVRYFILLSTFPVYFYWRSDANQEGTDEERQPLIPKKPDNDPTESNDSSDSGYGTNSETTNTETTNTEATNSPSEAESPWERSEREAREQMEKRLKSEGNWFSYVKGFMIFAPLVWPVNNRRLQIQAGLVGLCLIAGNALNVLIPRQIGIVTDSLTNMSELHTWKPWVDVLIFAALRLLASEAGLTLLRQMLWLDVEYYSREALSNAAYSHVMRLSSEFHDNKSSSDLIVAIQHGQAISNMLESVCFQAIPMLIDLVAAFIYLSITFGAYEGFVTFATGTAFMQLAARMIARFSERRKAMVKTYFEEHYVRQAGIQGWHTVSAFNQIDYEENRYREAVNSHVGSVKSIYIGYYLRSAFQYLVLLSGLIAGAFLAVYQIVQGQATAGSFVMLLTYWGQITSPLRFFSTLGRSISQDLVDAERLLDIMLTEPTIKDKTEAPVLQLNGGNVVLKGVSFSYDKKKAILKNVNLSVPAGKTVAFVGATGAGKSTILKLLDRFYDVTEGSIEIDGQDIREVTLSSLRQSIGIVPQQPILFDDTVMNNIRYARLSATDEEVYDACKAAAIHDQISGFTDGYKSRVGERGIKLSGGELQRIAIARAILKQPKIVLLDEATSSVDTETEQKIQDGLRILCTDRTTFIVAHRLSTVMNADTIFVVSDGEVVERGNHEELLAEKGKYAELWSKQIFVRPKEPESTDPKAIDGSAAEPSQNTQKIDTDGANNVQDDETNEQTTPIAQQSTPILTSTPLNGKAKDKAAKTPNGNKKEGLKLNPAALEFTPSSSPVPRPEATSPVKVDWAETCQAEADSSDQMEKPDQADENMSRSSESVEANPHTQTRSEPSFSPIQSGGSPTTVIRDTPTPTPTPTPSSPFRSKTRQSSAPVTNTTTDVTGEAQVSTSRQQRQPSSRGRGGSRGRRGFRGRQWRGGRGSRNPSASNVALASANNVSN